MIAMMILGCISGGTMRPTIQHVSSSRLSDGNTRCAWICPKTTASGVESGKAAFPFGADFLIVAIFGSGPADSRPAFTWRWKRIGPADKTTLLQRLITVSGD